MADKVRLKSGRKKHQRLYNDFGDDEYSAWQAGVRRGDVEIFYRDDPETVLLEREIEEETMAQRQQEIAAAEQLVESICSKLSLRQQKVCRLKAEHYTFDEIADALKCSRRTVLNDWKFIRQVAYSIIEVE
ncbi:MAG: helix-turn-helix transcriptional regulator [Anaerolineae bacterium]|jgi:DNA-directed RNA polymerase specialized sigma24 family protein|nr:helix-turn-helix transcriptional regulator [Anaerolineae bacterium]